MAQIEGYSLWLQGIGNSTRGSKGGGIPVLDYSISGSRPSGTASGVGFGKGPADIGLNVTVNDKNTLVSQMSVASNAGQNLGRGRLEAILSSGCSHIVMDFDSTLVESVQSTYPSGGRFVLKLSILNPHFYGSR